MDALSLFWLFAVTAMLAGYATETPGHRFGLHVAFSCAPGSAYGLWQGAWPIGLVEAIRSLVALQRRLWAGKS